MNPELKARWVEALRSGKYEQGQNALRDGEDYFCCLGVLCDIASVRWVQLFGGRAEAAYADSTAEYTGIPSPETLDRAGLPAEQAQRLATMNDGGATFATIADYIEANL